MKILITGSSGFIGTNLVQSLLDDGYTVRGLDIEKPRQASHGSLYKHCDIRDLGELRREISLFSPTHVVHLGARTDLKGATIEDYAANTVGVENLMLALEGVTTVERVLYCSSRLVCRIGYSPASDQDYCPTTPYGESKVIGEQLVRAKNPTAYKWCLIRPTSIWGPWFGEPYRYFFDFVRAGKYIHPAGRSVEKSFGYVGNSVFQIRSLLECAPERLRGQVFYIGDYVPLDVLQFGQLISKAFGTRSVREVPYGLLLALAKVGDLAQAVGYKSPPLTSFRLDNLCTHMIHDFAELQKITGPLPYSLEAGIEKTVTWMRAQH